MFVLQNTYDDADMEDETVKKRVTAVLASLVVLREYMTVGVLASLMELEESAVIRTVQELRSILMCPGEISRATLIRPLHLSFSDFLVDKKRCTNSAFCINHRASNLEFAKACLRTMIVGLRRNPCDLDDPNAFMGDIKDLESLIKEHVPEHVRYACEHWTEHLAENEPTDDPVLRQLLEDFCKEKLLPWIELQSLMRSVDYARRALARVYSRVKVSVLLRCKIVY
jgi:hypothetical protein